MATYFILSKDSISAYPDHHQVIKIVLQLLNHIHLTIELKE